MSKKPLEGDEYFFIAIIYLDEFIKRTLMGLYYTWQKFDISMRVNRNTCFTT